jgi:hypothetical protein
MIVMYNIISGMIGAITVSILRQTSSSEVAHLWEVLLSFYFPTYNLNNCFLKVYNNEFGRDACKKINCNIEAFKAKAPLCCGSEEGLTTLYRKYVFAERSYADNVLSTTTDKGIAFGVIFFIFQGFLFWGTTILIENGYIGKCTAFIKNLRRRRDRVNNAFLWSDVQPNSLEDSDVIEEQNLVSSMYPEKHPLLVKNLCKRFVYPFLITKL